MQIMDELRDGDAVALLPAVGPQLAEQDKLHTSHEKVLQMLDRCKVGYQKADLNERLQKARGLLAKSEKPNKQIYVISDMQAVSWENSGRSDESSAAGDVPVIFVNCDSEAEPNAAVRSVVLTAPVPTSGLPISVEVELFNASSLAVERYVELFVNGKRIEGSPAIELPPGGTATHVFRFIPEGGGLLRGEVRLSGTDGLPRDDSRYFAVELDRGIPVALVNQQAHEIPHLEDTFYLQRALELGGKDSRAVRAGFLSAVDLQVESLSRYEVVFCVNLVAPDPATTRRLAEYVSEGGNLVWVCGDNVDPSAYDRMNRRSEDMLLPAPLVDVRTPGPDNENESWPVGFLDKEYPPFASLVDPVSLYRSVLVYKHVRMDVSAAPSARVLAKLEDGEPLLVERSVGRGRVLMLGTSAHTGWSNLPLRPVFLPLLTRLIFELSGEQPSCSDLLSGTPLVLPLEEGAEGEVEVTTGDGETFRLPADGEKFTFDATHAPGIYVMRLLKHSPEISAAFSINADPGEFDPARMPAERLDALLPDTPRVYAEDATDLSSTISQLREGTNLYTPLLWLVLIGLVLEAFTANRRR